MPAADLARIAPGMKAMVYPPSGAPVAASVRMVAPTVDAQTRSGLVYVDIAKPGDARAGMFARGEITLGNAQVLTLPQSAVQLRDGFHYVYRVEGDGRDGRVTQTKVVVGRRQGERIEIVSGIDGTMRVVESGVGFLADGDTVHVVDTPPAKPAAPATPAATK